MREHKKKLQDRSLNRSVLGSLAQEVKILLIYAKNGCTIFIFFSGV